jgi:flagellar hook-associated protein 1 FlgK
MSLSSAINTAQSILSNTAKQTSVISQNIAGAGNPDYSRRSAELVSSLLGAQVVGIDRAQNAALLRQLLSSISGSSAQDALLGGLEKLKATMGGNDYESAPATLIAALRDALQTYAAKPSDATAGQSAIAAAKDVANGLSDASEAIQTVRADADAEIARSVEDLNTLLARFADVNKAVMEATQSGKDASSALDERDKLLKSISGYVGINTAVRGNNDMVIYTKDGTTLFETVPRAVTFTPTSAFAAGVTGNQILIDGVPLQAGDGSNTTASGKLQALLQLRDEAAPVFQSQLDEIARALVTTFAETDQTDPANKLPGLFTWSGGTIPSDGTLVPGLAASISVNAAVDPSQGGDPALLRDGGINGADFVANTEGGEGFSGLLDSFVAGLDEPMAFDASAKAGETNSLLAYASNSIGWLERYRSDAAASAENKDALLSRSQGALSNATGVSIDEEMSRLLDLEQSFKASAKIIATVDAMLGALMDAVR